MKKIATLLLIAMVVSASHAQSQDEMEIKQLIMDGNEYVRTNMVAPGEDYSQHGALEFWSSGGLLQEIPPGGRRTEFDAFNVRPKHIRVISLVEGQAAVAYFYSEGSMKPKGSPSAGNYLTRVSQVYVKENGEWKIRASHWSPVLGGVGTTQTAQQN